MTIEERLLKIDKSIAQAQEKHLGEVNHCLVTEDGRVLYHEFDKYEISKLKKEDIWLENVSEYQAHFFAVHLTK